MVTPSARTKNDGHKLCGAEEFGQLIQTWLQAAASGHGRRHGDSRIGVGRDRVESCELGPDRSPDQSDPLVRGVGGVERVEDEVDAATLVLTVELGVAVVVADQRTAANAVDCPDKWLPGL